MEGLLEDGTVISSCYHQRDDWQNVVLLKQTLSAEHISLISMYTCLNSHAQSHLYIHTHTHTYIYIYVCVYNSVCDYT